MFRLLYTIFGSVDDDDKIYTFVLLYFEISLTAEKYNRDILTVISLKLLSYIFNFFKMLLSPLLSTYVSSLALY